MRSRGSDGLLNTINDSLDKNDSPSRYCLSLVSQACLEWRFPECYPIFNITDSPRAEQRAGSFPSNLTVLTLTGREAPLPRENSFPRAQSLFSVHSPASMSTRCSSDVQRSVGRGRCTWEGGTRVGIPASSSFLINSLTV